MELLSSHRRVETKVAPGDSFDRLCCLHAILTRSTLTIRLDLDWKPIPIRLVSSGGIRTTGVVRVSATCDTISAVRGDSAVFTITLENIVDRPVTITAIAIDAAVAQPGVVAQPVHPSVNHPTWCCNSG
ncbi:MAG: hypothetical protein IPF59_14110 [Ignavibacteria bacterium]|nr:hypothetical protein [Ignavibacteria bacterium]